MYLELRSWAQMNSVSSSSSGDWRELACRGTDSQGAPVSVASPSIARPEAIHQSTTAEGQTHRAPQSVSSALLWPDLKKSISQPQKDRLTGHPSQCYQPFYGPTEAIHQSTTAGWQTHRMLQSVLPVLRRPAFKQSIIQPQQREYKEDLSYTPLSIIFTWWAAFSPSTSHYTNYTKNKKDGINQTTSPKGMMERKKEYVIS